MKSPCLKIVYKHIDEIKRKVLMSKKLKEHLNTKCYIKCSSICNLLYEEFVDEEDIASIHNYYCYLCKENCKPNCKKIVKAVKKSNSFKTFIKQS